MKKIITLAILLFSVIAFAQAPNKMSYQSVIRDNKGVLLIDKKVTIQISIVKGSEKGEAVYVETHKTYTNTNGLVTLEIGAGENKTGKFSDIDWANGSYFIKTATDSRGGSTFDIVGVSELLSVPYALHAKTVQNAFSGDFNDLRNKPTKLSEFINDIGSVNNSNLPSAILVKPGDGVPSQVWSLFGNSSTLSTRDKLGTTDYQDLVMVTNNIERLRITADGDINLANSLQIGKDLTVKRNVYLNTESGATINNGNFTVANTKATLLTGTLNTNGATDLDATLNVDGVTNLNSALNVNNAAPTHLTGLLDVDTTLNVDGATTLQSNLDVKNGAATHLTGVLNVDGATNINNTLTVAGETNLNSALSVNNAAPTHLTGILDVDQTLNVDGATTLQSSLDVKNGAPTHLTGTLVVDGVFELQSTLLVKNDVADGSYVATFENSNTGNGDGIQIKLGKAKVNNGIPATIPGLPSASQMADLKDLLRCDKSPEEKVTSLGSLVANGVVEDLQLIGGLAVGLVNLITTKINSTLGLPITSNIILGPVNDFCDPCVPDELLSAVIIPSIPELDLSGLGIATINLQDPNFWGLPSLCLSDTSGATPLNNENEFIRFTDNANAKVGSIRAVSINDWSSNYLNPVFLFTLRGALTSGVDKKHNLYHFKKEIFGALKEYGKMGVEYSSGNGDYAEWLERSDSKETISAGDIVAVKGGKISKDLANAEQVMAVSHQPIVLGNVPSESKVNFGNNVAFMGQIPVKIMGPVVTGDYIVGKGVIQGYGVAVHPEDMTVEDFKFAVGRSWDANPDNGPKLVNTVVGVHNGDFVHILKKMEDKYQQSESRLQSVEAKIDKLSVILSADAKTN